MSQANKPMQLQIDGKLVPWDEVINQLQLFGKLLPFIQDITSQKLLLKEISKRSDLHVDPVELDQEMNRFREKQDLSEEDRLHSWLEQERIDYQGLRTRIYLKLKISKLKSIISAPDIAEEFQSRSRGLEQVVIAYLLTADAGTASELKDQLQRGLTTFSSLADQSGDPAAPIKGLTVKAPAPPVRRSWLPKELQDILKTAAVGELHGPLAIGEQWMVVQVETISPAVLDTKLERQLTEDLFNRWLRRKLGETSIKLQSEGSASSEQS